MTKYLWKEAQDKIKNGNSFLVFTTPWCGDCKMMKPIFYEVEKQFMHDKINIQFIEVDAEESKLFRDPNALVQVLKIPAIYVVKNGQMQLLGYDYLPKEKIIQEIKDFIK